MLLIICNEFRSTLIDRPMVRLISNFSRFALDDWCYTLLVADIDTH